MENAREGKAPEDEDEARDDSEPRPKGPVGISNRPLEEEVEQQEHLPPRGTRKRA